MIRFLLHHLVGALTAPLLVNYLNGPRVIPMGRPGKTGIAAAKRRARQARNRRRARHVCR